MTKLHYIVFTIDDRCSQHDGKVFSSYEDAKQFAVDGFAENDCTKAVVGVFEFDKNAESMMITMVESMGFKGDKRNVNQLALFKSRF
jgi:hypothetical protein